MTSAAEPVVATVRDPPAEPRSSTSLCDHPAPRFPVGRWLRRLAGPALEIATAFATAGLFVLWARQVRINPIDRIGQVSGLAALQFRFLLVGLVVLAAVVLSLRGGPAIRPWVTRLSCAALAGAASGFVAGGVVLALTGTPWPLFADMGDAGRLAEWAADLVAGRSVPELDLYPPAFIHALAWYAELTGQSTSYALKDLEIIGTACLGPVAYLCWRMHLRPAWALGIGITAMLPVVDAYKPYEPLVMIAFVPFVATFLRLLRRADQQSTGRLVRSGAATGAALGLLLLTYAGWFVWSAAGVAVATAALVNWRRPRQAMICLAAAAAAFLAVAGWYLVRMLPEAVHTKDTFFTGSTRLDPAVVINLAPRDLAGMGALMILLVIGVGVAISLGYRRSYVIAAVACLASAWLMRFRYASEMYQTQTVQLYPRTSAFVLHCLVLLAGFAVLLVATKARRWLAGRGAQFAPEIMRPALTSADPTHITVVSEPTESAIGLVGVGLVGSLAALVLGFGMAASAVSDGLMPKNQDGARSLAWFSHNRPTQEGTCPTYAERESCR